MEKREKEGNYRQIKARYLQLFCEEKWKESLKRYNKIIYENIIENTILQFFDKKFFLEVYN